MTRSEFTRSASRGTTHGQNGTMDDISTVVFDWYATLGAPNDDDFWPRLPDLIERAGGVVDTAALQSWDVGHPSLHPGPSRSEETYRRWQRGRLEELFQRCELDEPGRSDLLDFIEDQRYRRSFEVFADVPDVLEELRRRGRSLGICSNWDWGLDRHLAANGIAEYFDFVVCSAEVGCRKPHPAIFAIVGDHADVDPHRIRFVGDNWGDDVCGATAAGMQPVHVTRLAECGVADDHGTVPCIGGLDELLDIPG